MVLFSFQQRFGENVGQLLDPNHASMLKSAVTSGQPAGYSFFKTLHSNLFSSIWVYAVTLCGTCACLIYLSIFLAASMPCASKTVGYRNTDNVQKMSWFIIILLKLYID